MRKRLRAVVAVGFQWSFLVTFLPAFLMAGAAGAQERSESVRVATFNAYLMSPFFKCFNPNFADCLIQINGETEEWANKLADTILADPDRFDIIAINEAWDEDAKSILVRRLRPVYPNFVRKIDADLIQVRGQAIEDILTGQPQAVIDAVFGGAPISKINGEDSGLMLFANAKFRFLALPSPAFKWGPGSSESLQASTTEVAFTLFERCGSDDCFSAKGAALVRLQHIPSGRIWNVAFTHLQADYPEDDDFFAAERRSQFRQIEKLIRNTLAPLETREQNERVILMGDLNVAPLTTGQAEWSDRFDTAGSFFTQPLYDAWARTTSRRDTGITQQNDHERLDYILSFPAPYTMGDLEGPVCIQHMTIPTDFRDLASDHYLVHADLNIGNFHCSPQIAFEVDLKTTANPGQPPQESASIDTAGGTDVTQIRRPGQMQWLHVKKGQAGTYSISRSTAQVRLDIYAPDDLTTPISRYNKTTVSVVFGDSRLFIDTYVLPREFYIRASGVDRGFRGNYALQIKRHNCSSKAEACILQPGQPQPATLTRTGNPLGMQNEAWFAFDVLGTSDSGIDQTITLTAGGLPASANFTTTLEDFTNTSGIPAPGAVADGAQRIFSSQMGDGSTGYLVIAQGEPTADDVKVTALLDTSLRLLDVFNLICIDETNPELGSDDMFTEFTVDGVTTRAPSNGEVEFDCDDTSDEQNWVGQVGKPTITFVDQVGVKLLEEDDSSGDDPSRFQTLPSLAATDTILDGRLKPIWWKFEDGEYHFTFVLRKRPNAPVK